MKATKIGLMGLVAVSTVGMFSIAQAKTEVHQIVGIPTHVSADLSGVVCDNTGSTVDISGAVTLGGFNVNVIFRNNVKGTKELVKLGELTLEVAPKEESVSIPKQPVNGGVGGNPHMSFQLNDVGATTVPLTERIYLGRCVQGFTTHIERDVVLRGNLGALLQSLECSNKGSSIDFGTDADHGGIDGTLFLDNNYNKVVHEQPVAATAKFKLTPSLTLHKGWGRQDGAGGNPLIYIQWLDSDKNPAKDPGGNLVPETFVGRCNKI